MDRERSITVERTVRAWPARVFAFLCDPGHHRAFDTSGMVRGARSQAPILGVGAVFVMAMYNPIKGHHTVENHVVVFDPDRSIGWAPAEPGSAPAGHTWVWRLEPGAGADTLISQTYDWSAFTHLDLIDRLPVVGRAGLRRSLDLLAQAVE